MMAIADVFDAVSAKRCYRDALPMDVCFKIIEDGKGTDFDPDLVDLFLTTIYQHIYLPTSPKVTLIILYHKKVGL